MTLRDHCTTAQLQAHAVLDKVKLGYSVDGWKIVEALRILGEPVA